MGTKYAVSMTCCVTGYNVTDAVPDCKASTIALFILKNWISPIWKFFKLTSDEGSDLTGKVISHLQSMYKFKHAVTSAYHQSANGVVERYSRTLGNYLRCIADEYGIELYRTGNWNRYLFLCSAVQNDSIFRKINMTPNQCVLLNPVRKFIDQEINAIHGIQTNDIKNYMIDIKQQRKIRNKLIKISIDKYNKYKKEYYDKFREKKVYPIESMVMYYIYDQKVGVYKKMTPKWKAPCFIVDYDKKEIIIFYLSSMKKD